MLNEKLSAMEFTLRVPQGDSTPSICTTSGIYVILSRRYLYCPNGSHLSMWDDQQVFMTGVIKFIHDVDAGGM